MAAGLLLDAFLIRAALVRALFGLIGPRIWYPSRTAGSGRRVPDRGNTGPVPKINAALVASAAAATVTTGPAT